MLETMVSVVNVIRTTVSCGLYLSYKAGSFLVSSISTIYLYFTVFLDNLAGFSAVLWESSVIFLQDIFQFIQQILFLVTAAVETIYTSVAAVFLKISFLVSSVLAVISLIYNGLVNGVATLIASTGQAVVLLKKLVILFGLGVWFLITFVPLLLYYLCTVCVSFIHSVYREICDICSSGVLNARTLIKNTVLFILDVPIESLAGIVVALSLAYIGTQFYSLLIPYIKRQLRKLRNWSRHWEVMEFRVLNFAIFSRQPTREQQVPTPRARQPVRRQRVAVEERVQTRYPARRQRNVREKCEDSFLRDDKCVICQERNKCILLLPCRHLCLCSECTRELRYYNEICPICRTNIESTMQIFV